MTYNLPPKVVSRRGITLLELALVIIVLLGFVSLAFVATRAWKRGSERSLCILTLRNMQMAARSYQNLHGYDYGARPDEENGTQDIAQHLHDKGYIEDQLFNRASGVAPCPSGGGYDCPSPDIFPEPGQLYMKCSLSATAGHQPSSTSNW